MMEEGRFQCDRHQQEVVAVCRSPHCRYFRKLCRKCAEEDERHSKVDHREWREAVEEALGFSKKAITRIKALRASKNEFLQESINQIPGLWEIIQKLSEIEKVVMDKLRSFKNHIKLIYSEHVRERLEELDEVISKSEQLLQTLILQMQDRKDYRHLGVFFEWDLENQLAYYESYFKEIKIKKIRAFKTALEQEKVFTLMMNFQQNLEEIFSISRKKTTREREGVQTGHLFLNEDYHCSIMTIRQDQKKLSVQPIAGMNRISQSNRLHQSAHLFNYEWLGTPESVYYPPTNCYYIIGEGEKESQSIVKYQAHKGPDAGFVNIRLMESVRRNFSVCLLRGEIYIIGGENEKDGCLARCQKFVPEYNNQVYIIQSLNQRSSRHSISTYKDKYILKFGGVSVPLDPDQPVQGNKRRCLAFPEVYSLEREEWSTISFKQNNEVIMGLGIHPIIFKNEASNLILVLGGDRIQGEDDEDLKDGYRPAFELLLEGARQIMDKIKIKKRLSRIRFSTTIFNSTILFEEDNRCMFIKKDQSDNEYRVSEMEY